ncbi:KDPG and KHG aldolase [Pelosinus fermentans JBW45]|uniref:KDPG and KHG aldolase n=1 Tax=Pelosinus fermentans JBW45 TaxID=1192197 RepID=I8U118_9FIRM|nr:KDPG and KHG aldolase [Pelosinus fermentans JBW45]
MGTVLDPETARIAILSDAQYVVSPCLNINTVKLCNRYRIPIMPGAMTIKEVVEGMEAGADIIRNISRGIIWTYQCSLCLCGSILFYMF